MNEQLKKIEWLSDFLKTNNKREIEMSFHVMKMHEKLSFQSMIEIECGEATFRKKMARNNLIELLAEASDFVKNFENPYK